MRIADLQLIPLRVPFSRERVSSWNVRRGSSIGLVKITDSDGVVGFGDFLSRPSFAYGSAVLDAIRPVLEGADVYDGEHISNTALSIGSWNMKGQLSYSAAWIVAAIDVALWDIRAKRSGVPLYKLLGGATNASLGLSYQVPSGPQDVVAEEIARARRLGVRALSVKLGKLNKSIDEDVDSIRRIRELAPELPISVDANHAWTVGTAVKILKRLEAFDILFCESPSRGIANLRDIRMRTGVPIAADEDAWSLQNIFEIARTGAADLVLIDVASLGGITNALKALGILEAANIPAAIHGNGEIVTCRAGYHLAFAKPALGIYPHQYYYELLEGPLTPGGGGNHPGQMPLPADVPGIMTINQDELRNYADDDANWVSVVRASRAPHFPKY